MRAFAVATTAILSLAAFAAAQESAPGSQVTIPLAEYERLRTPDAESVTVVDAARLSGSFRERNLSISFTGRSVGSRSSIPVLRAEGGLTLWNCSGSGIVTRGEQGFRLRPLADTFTATCRIAASGSDRLELTSTREVLAVESAVVDGELVAADANGDGTQRYSLVRQSAGAAQNIAPTATGRYLLTLLPDEARFRYAIEVHNPNRSRRPFEVRLLSGEHVQQIDAVAPYEVIEGAYRFDLPPGDTTIVMTGQLAGDSFRPPVDASLQYLAIESHPIVRPRVEGSPKRISATEAGVPIQFRGPQAFLLGSGETVRWKKTKLEAMHTTSFAVTSARHTLFVAAEGSALGESAFAVDNQGASDLTVPVRPEPTYASIGGEALLMTKGSDGKLTIPLSPGKQDIVVQHKQSIRKFLGFAAGKLAVPQLTVPATSLMMTMNYPRQWYPVIESFSTRTKIWRPSDSMLILFVALLVWTERLLAWLRLPLRRRLVIATLFALAAIASTPLAVLVLLLNASFSITWLISILQGVKWTTGRALFATAILVLVLFGLLTTTQVRDASEEYDSGLGRVVASAPPPERSEVLLQKGMQDAKSLDYQGLPARFEVPSGERHSRFTQEMLSVEREHSVAVVLVSATLVWFLTALLAVAAVFAVWRSRTALVAGVRERLAARAINVEGQVAPTV